jgi:hypothetical protein
MVAPLLLVVPLPLAVVAGQVQLVKQHQIIIKPEQVALELHQPFLVHQ